MNFNKYISKNYLSNKRFFITGFITLVFSVISFSSQAVHISTYRIYLDKDNRDSSFMIFNQDAKSQECNLKLRHYNFDDNGVMTNYEGDDLPPHSAKNWLRFSPKKFTLTPANTQTVRFSMRRKARAEAAEYRSYLVVDCGAIALPEDEGQLISIQPKLIHNVPIIVRTKALEAKVTFEDIVINNGILNFNLTRSGNRSIYGKIELLNKLTNTIIGNSRGISVYTESSKYPLDYKVGELELKNMKLRFIEDTKYGGSINYEQDLALK
jgi:P pilus assembly chaperone PapD